MRLYHTKGIQNEGSHFSLPVSPYLLPPEAGVYTGSCPVWWPVHVGAGHRGCGPGKSLIGRPATAHVSVTDGLWLCGA